MNLTLKAIFFTAAVVLSLYAAFVQQRGEQHGLTWHGVAFACFATPFAWDAWELAGD